MSSSLTLLFLVSLTELVVLVVVLVFFFRLKRSEALLSALQENQENLLKKLHFNAELEQELVSTFAQRQAGLEKLDEALDAKTRELEKLIKQAESVSRSPQFLREIILSGRRQGRTIPELASSTGLSMDEVELILEQAEH
ncbi:hypothetical protein [Desulfocurvus sp. DL9XJH121]